MRATKRYSQLRAWAIGCGTVVALLGASVLGEIPGHAEPTQGFSAQADVAPGQLDLSEIQGVLARRMPSLKGEKRLALATRILQVSLQLDFQPAFLLSVIETESHFRAGVVSHAGAVGLMQLLPATARFIANNRGISEYRGPIDLKNPVVNVTLGAHYLSFLRARFGGSREMMMAYNAGPARAAQILSRNLGRFPAGKRGAIAHYVDQVHEGVERIVREGRFEALFGETANRSRLAAGSGECTVAGVSEDLPI